MIHRRYRRADSALSRRIKTALAASGFTSVKAFEKATSLPTLALGTFLRTSNQQSPERRRMVLAALESRLGLPVAEIATLAGITPDGGLVVASFPSGDILDHLQDRGDITPRQADAARWFRLAACGLSFPGLHPCRDLWKTPLLAAWGALEAADAIIARQHRGCPPASFTVWRIVIEGDRPGWLSPDADLELARLERLALWTGLEALAAAASPP